MAGNQRCSLKSNKTIALLSSPTEDTSDTQANVMVNRRLSILRFDLETLPIVELECSTRPLPSV
jgi:hypothetical protein